ncbi:EpsG family protein [Citrobacter portucalensis]|uniref:EpsG family protein n=1 Tax=Citrobacter portucalensis TaxID=1639133 RepID=UPI003BF59C1A
MSNVVVILIVTTLFIINRQNQDYQAYVDIFNINESYAEVGYRWLIFIVKYFGGNHNSIIIILGLLVGVTIYRLNKYSIYTSFALLLYMLCPMPVDIVQVRNTFMLIFFINALIELEKKRKLMSLSYMFLVVLFHSLGFLYFLAWVAIQFRHKKAYAKLMIFGLISAFIVTPILIKTLVILFDTRTLQHYISQTLKFHSLIIWGGPFFLNLLLLYEIKNRIVITNTSINRWIEINIALLLFLSIFTPFLLYIDEINRVYRNSMILNYFALISVSQYMRKIQRYALYIYLFAFALALSVYYTNQIDYDYIMFGMQYSL